MSEICPGCHHAPHAGRCEHITCLSMMPSARVIWCHCTHRREANDGTDSPASGGSRGAAVPVGDAQGRAPVDRVVVTICDYNANEERLRRAVARQELAKLGGELADGAEDILARIREVGQTMTDAAARLEGEPRA